MLQHWASKDEFYKAVLYDATSFEPVMFVHRAFYICIA